MRSWLRIATAARVDYGGVVLLLHCAWLLDRVYYFRRAGLQLLSEHVATARMFAPCMHATVVDAIRTG